MTDDLDRELERLAVATSKVRAGTGFEARVMGSLPDATASRWDASVLRFGKTMLFVAALSAVLGVVLGIQSDREADQATAATYGMEELDL
jgi:hypothetical protein